MTILITGAQGQLGSALKNYLAEKRNCPIVALTKDQLNITDSAAIERCFKQYRPQWVINTAAYTAVDDAQLKVTHAYSVNTLAVDSLAAQCAHYGAKLIHFSTDYVFNGMKNAPYVEEDLCLPLSVYGRSKYASEQAVTKNLNDYVILRVSWLFSRSGTSFIQKIAALSQQPERDFLSIVDDQIGCPTSVESIAAVVDLLIGSYPHINGLFHYSDQPAVSWFDFAHEIQRQIADSHPLKKMEIHPIKSVQMNARAKRPQNSVLDCAKICGILPIAQADWRSRLDFLSAF